MAVIGNATLNIVPKVQGGLASAISGEVKKANLSSIGKSAGSSFLSGITSGMSFGIWSNIASRAIDTVTGSLDSAASRVDTLNNYPRIMESLGVSSDDASASMKKMSTSLDNVPTRLDDMASTVQGIYAATMKYGTSLDTVTDAGLALNSMLLAGGQSTSVATAAMEQFRQMVAKGKPDMQDWRSLISAAPGQMEQLAKSMLDAEATASDLYAALGGGKEGDYEGPYEWGSISMGEFVERFSKMRDQFEGAAEEAQAGIGTSFANMKNAVTKGVANVLNAFGQERIASAIGDVKGAINTMSGKDDTEGIRAFATEVAPLVSDAWDTMTSGVSDFYSKTAPAIGSIADTVLGIATDVGPDVMELAGTFSDGLAGAINVAADGIKDIDGIFRYGFEGAVTGKNKVKALDDAIGAISGTTEAVDRAFDILGEGVERSLARAEESADKAREAHERYLDSVAKASDTINDANDAHEVEADRLEHAASVIDLYMGKTELTMTQQRELADAIDYVNEKCGTHYGVLEDGYTVIDTESDKIQGNTDKIWDNVRAREAASKAESIGTAKSEVEGLIEEAALDYQAQRRAADDAGEAMDNLIAKYGSLEKARDAASRGANRNVAGGFSTKEDVEANRVYQTWVKAAEGMREAELAEREHQQTYAELAAQQEALYRVSEAGADRASLSLSDLAVSSGVAAKAMSTDMTRSLVDFGEAIEKCVSEADGDRLRDALADPDTMAEIVAAYDGTAESLGNVMRGMGVGWDEAAAKTLDAQGSIQKMGDYLVNLDTETYGAMASIGESADSMALKLSDAGVSMEQLARVGEGDFRTMLDSCGGDISMLTSMVALYNQQGIEDKEGKISVDQVPLVDAQGNVFTWNGTELKDKSGKAVVKDKELVDAYGNVVVWNGTELKVKSAKVSADQGNLPTVLANLQTFRNMPDTITKSTKVTNTTHNVTINEARSATGPTQEYVAHGGHVEPRKHAAGFIAAGPTRTPFGIIGEDGVEAYYRNDDGTSDVYPLNNPRYLGYADPLADRIAKGVASSLDGVGKRPIALYVTCSGDANDVANAIVSALELYDM